MVAAFHDIQPQPNDMFAKSRPVVTGRTGAISPDVFLIIAQRYCVGLAAIHFRDDFLVAPMQNLDSIVMGIAFCPRKSLWPCVFLKPRFGDFIGNPAAFYGQGRFRLLRWLFFLLVMPMSFSLYEEKLLMQDCTGYLQGQLYL
jgi:hypothetical protein